MVEIAVLAWVSQVSALMAFGVAVELAPDDLTSKMIGCSEKDHQRVAFDLQPCSALYQQCLQDL